jgi:hypothetical protein
VTAPSTTRAAVHQRQYRKQRYLTGPSRVDATGTHRRLQALQAVGWNPRALGERLNYSRNWVYEVLDRPVVNTFTADVVRRLYDELWDQVPPQRKPYELAAFTRQVNRARRAGFAPPLAWDDDTIDDPAAAPALPANPPGPRRGRATSVTVSEYAHFRAFGMGEDRIAERLGLTTDGLRQALERAS